MHNIGTVLPPTLARGPYLPDALIIYRMAVSGKSTQCRSFPIAIQVLRNAYWGGGCQHFPEKKRYGALRFNVISVTRGWAGV